MDCLKIETIGMHLLRGTLDTVGTLLLLAWTFTGFSSNFFVLNFARWRRLHSKPVFRFCPFLNVLIQPHNFEQRVLTWQETTIWSCIKTFDHLNLKFQNYFFFFRTSMEDSSHSTPSPMSSAASSQDSLHRGLHNPYQHLMVGSSSLSPSAAQVQDKWTTLKLNSSLIGAFLFRSSPKIISWNSVAKIIACILIKLDDFCHVSDPKIKRYFISEVRKKSCYRID